MKSVRRNADDRLRVLERVWRETSNAVDGAAYFTELVRAGRTTLEKLRLLARMDRPERDAVLLLFPEHSDDFNAVAAGWTKDAYDTFIYSGPDAGSRSGRAWADLIAGDSEYLYYEDAIATRCDAIHVVVKATHRLLAHFLSPSPRFRDASHELRVTFPSGYVHDCKRNKKSASALVSTANRLSVLNRMIDILHDGWAFSETVRIPEKIIDRCSPYTSTDYDTPLAITEPQEQEPLNADTVEALTDYLHDNASDFFSWPPDTFTIDTDTRDVEAQPPHTVVILEFNRYLIRCLVAWIFGGDPLEVTVTTRKGKDVRPGDRRRNSDERRRGAERRAAAGGSAVDDARVLTERLRAGDLSVERLEAAASLGHPAARMLAPVPTVGIPDGYEFAIPFVTRFPLECVLLMIDMERAMLPMVRWYTHDPRTANEENIDNDRCTDSSHIGMEPGTCPRSRFLPHEIAAWSAVYDDLRLALLEGRLPREDVIQPEWSHWDLFAAAWAVRDIAQHGIGEWSRTEASGEGEGFPMFSEALTLFHFWDGDPPVESRPAWIAQRLSDLILHPPASQARPNPDEERREIERRSSSSGSQDDAAALLSRRLRAGELVPEQVLAAAFFGDPAAALVIGPDTLEAARADVRSAIGGRARAVLFSRDFWALKLNGQAVNESPPVAAALVRWSLDCVRHVLPVYYDPSRRCDLPWNDRWLEDVFDDAVSLVFDPDEFPYPVDVRRQRLIGIWNAVGAVTQRLVPYGGTIHYRMTSAVYRAAYVLIRVIDNSPPETEDVFECALYCANVVQDALGSAARSNEVAWQDQRLCDVILLRNMESA